MKTITSLIVGCTLFFGVGPSTYLNAQNPHEGQEEHEEHGGRSMDHHAMMKKILMDKGASEAQLLQAHRLLFEVRMAAIDAEAKIKKAALKVEWLMHNKGSKLQDVEVAIDTLFAAKAEAHKLRVRGLFGMREIFGEKTWAAVAPILLPMLHDHEDEDADHEDAGEDDEHEGRRDEDDEDEDGDDEEDDDDGEEEDDEEDEDEGKKKHRG